jgi:RHS repeat-associated protein
VGTRVEAYGYGDSHGNDANGCMTGVGSLVLDWDANDHLAVADLSGGGTAWYAYDASGRRVRKVVDDQNGNPRSETIYVGTYEVRRTFGGNASTRESLHVMDDTRRIALIESESGAASVLRYELGDHLGSSAVELDGAAALISYEEYHPFGTSAFQAGRSVAEVSLKRYRFTGSERDEETGFDYHRSRYCAPWLGRWVSADPAGLVDGPNLYRYARNNPVRLTDPNGTDPPRVDQSSPRVTPILTDIEPTGVSGNFQFHDLLSSDRSVSGSGVLGLRARTGLLLDVPQLNLHTSGWAFGAATVGVDTSLGRAGVIAQGGLLLGDLNGFNLGIVGSGSLRTTVPGRIPLGSVADTLTAGLPTAEGNLRLHGELATGSTSLLRFDAVGSLANGAFNGQLDGTTILNVGRLHASVSGHVDPGGSVTLDSAQLRASATVPGLSVTANARGVGDGRGGLNVTADASVRLFGLQSIRAQGTGNVSASGASLAGTFSGPGPLFSSYITGDFNLNTRGGNTVNATVLGLGYTPGITLAGPASPPPGSGLGSPRTPWQPSGLSIGATRFNYSQGNLNYLSVGLFPDLSSNLFSNVRVGAVFSTSF